jgi:Protein of unknown function (DUF1501)
MMFSPHRHPYGVVRREFLQVGFSGFVGLGLPGLLARQAQAEVKGRGEPRAKSLILIFLTGAPSHVDMFDMKPDAPEGIRGEFQPIDTKAPGVQMCEHLPSLASHADKLAIVRTLSHHQTNHLNGTHQLMTGHPQPGAFFDKIASRDDYPCYASALEYIRPSHDGVPRGVMLPTFLMEGPLTWPGQHSGFLGPKYDPWQIRQDPNKPNFRVDNLALPEGFSVERLQTRKGMLDELSAQRDEWQSRAEKDPYSGQRELAYSLLLSGKVAHAFELDREPSEVRDRYGRHMYGQSLLLARRLVQAGISVVQANMGAVQTWDSHNDIFGTLKSRLLPPFDQGVGALLSDLDSLGMLDETLVVITGEFGRTPRIFSQNKGAKPGRDHWAAVFSAVFAGAGVRGGQVIGQSDKIGAYPASRKYTPGDMAATIYCALGIDPATELHDRLGRPSRLCTGERIEPLYSGAVG